MDLSIIIVNWNSKDYLKKCISSIIKKTNKIEYEIIVIENASFDGSNVMVQKYFPVVKFFQLQKNIGFAKANNEAFKISSGKYVLFLNPDTELVNNSIDVMYEALKSIPNAGAFGCKLLNSDRSIQTSCIQAFPTIINQILDTEALRSLFPMSKLWGMSALFERESSIKKVDAISGACIMLRSSIFHKVGLFSEDYFMYSEDIDLCYKIYKAGYNNYFIPNAKIIHYGGGSSKELKNFFSVIETKKSLFLYFKKNYSIDYALLYRILIIITGVIRTLIMSAKFFITTIKVRDKISYKNSYFKWKNIIKWGLKMNKAGS